MRNITDPPEIFLQIASHLHHGDLFQLIRVSKSVQALVEPLLWRGIELHRPQYHEDHAFDKNENIPRPYKRDVAHGLPLNDIRNLHHHYSDTARIFINKFENSSKENDRLARHVRWLCLEVDQYQDDSDLRDCWNMFTNFTNLEYLEIHARWSGVNEINEFNVAAAPLEKLHTIKLRGFIPKYFVDYLLQSPSHIRELQLAVLDNPIGGSNYNPRSNPPPEQPEVPDEFEGMTDEEVIALDEQDDFNDEAIAPRTLICLPNTIVSQFKALTRLWLCKPTDAFHDKHSISIFFDFNFSESLDTKSFHEWANLLVATRETLTHLTLEHRPVALEIEMDSTGSNEFMGERRKGPSYQRFREIVLPHLLDTQGWSALKQITLIGVGYNGTICWNCIRCNKTCEKARHPYEQPQVASACAYCLEKRFHCQDIPRDPMSLQRELEDRFPSVHVNSLLGRRMLFNPEDGEPCHYDSVLGDDLDVEE